MTFYTTPGTSNGSVAGPGLYCAKAPSGSFSYGDRVIRIDFVEDVVIYDSLSGRYYCGHNGNFYPQSECNKKGQNWDVKFYSGGGSNNYAWYVIRNPNVVSSWTANSSQLIKDLQADKRYGGSSYVVHADTTINLINSEVKVKGKATTYSNSKKRMALEDILKSQDLIAKIPPLSLIASIHASTKISSTKKVTHYHQQFKRALKDTLLTYDNYQETITLDKNIKQSFLNVINNTINSTSLDQYSAIILISAVNEFNISIPPSSAIRLWQQAFNSSSDLDSIIKAKIDNHGIFAQNFTSSLPSPGALSDKLDEINYNSFVSLLDNYFDRTKSTVDGSEYLKFVLEKVLKKSAFKVLGIYNNIKNSSLNKENALIDIFKNESKNKFKGHDPIYLGQLLDVIKNDIGKNELQQFQNDIKNLDLQVVKRHSYIILDDFEKGNISLPSFISEKEYIIKLVKLSIDQRVNGAGSTNTYRFVLSGLWHYIKRKMDKDANNKSNILKYAQDLFVTISKSFKNNDMISYSYIAAQNASYYFSNMKYTEHPMEYFYNDYDEKRNSPFDLFFEQVSSVSLDAGYLNYLSTHAKEDKAKTLINKMMDFYTGKKFDSYLSSDDFKRVDHEKSIWSNILYNTNLGSTDNGWIRGNHCAWVMAIEKNIDTIKKVLPSNKWKDLSDKNDKLKGTYNVCK